MTLRIAIAGGGTGGHLFPGIALAHAFQMKDPENRVLFVGTDKPMELKVISSAGFDHQHLRTEGIKGRRIGRQIAAILKIPKSLCRSLGILHRFKPDLVIGVGSYVSGPVVIAAWFLAIKSVLCEQNIFPGITNRVLIHFCTKLYASFEETKQYINPKKFFMAGTPVRKEMIRPMGGHGENTGSSDENRCFTVLILGGSQGAHSINTAVTRAVKRLKIKKGISFIHQTGTKDKDTVTAVYTTHGVDAKIKPFITDMAEAYRQADLVICRAGATTIAEITAIGKPAVFIPYPFAADNHQELNARVLVGKGAAKVILERDLTGKRLVELISYFYKHPRELKQMAAMTKKMGCPDAAEIIVKDCYKIIASKKASKSWWRI